MDAAELERAKAEIERLRAALVRLGSMEAFVVSRAVTAGDAELIARIEYAQAAVKEQPVETKPPQ